MNFKNLIIVVFILYAPWVNATEVKIDVTNLQYNVPVFISEGGELNRVPESGMLKMKVKNLPTIIQLVSIEKSKIETHKTIWLTGSTLEISSSNADDINLSPANSGEVLPNNIEEEWKQINIEKKPEFTPSQPFLVYLVNNINRQETDYVRQIIDQIPEEKYEFWATERLIAYLEEFDNAGFDPSEKQFEHLTAINKKGEKERFDRPKDKFLLIDFSSSACKPCLIDIDKLVKLKEDFGDDLEILSIWDDTKQEAWINIAKKQKDKISWVSLRDESQAILKKFGIDIYPTYIMVNPDGKVEKEWKGSGIEKARKYLRKNR
ncbi:MAG: thioredoxin family protein [Bacteroidota bacterium]